MKMLDDDVAAYHALGREDKMRARIQDLARCVAGMQPATPDDPDVEVAARRSNRVPSALTGMRIKRSLKKAATSKRAAKKSA